MLYFYDRATKAFIHPYQLVPMMRRFNDLDSAIQWFDNLDVTTIDGSIRKDVNMQFTYCLDARDEYIETNAKSLREAVAQCPDPEYDIYLYGIDSYGYLLPVNCNQKFNSYYKPKDIRLDHMGRVELHG